MSDDFSGDTQLSFPSLRFFERHPTFFPPLRFFGHNQFSFPSLQFFGRQSPFPYPSPEFFERQADILSDLRDFYLPASFLCDFFAAPANVVFCDFGISVPRPPPSPSFFQPARRKNSPASPARRKKSPLPRKNFSDRIGKLSRRHFLWSLGKEKSCLFLRKIFDFSI